MERKSCTLLALAIIGLLVMAGSVLAKDYPNHPITRIVPYGAGGSTDLTARIVAGEMEKRLKEPVIVKNVNGAGGQPGLKEVVKASPDGYTIGYTPLGSLVFQPHMRKIDPLIDDIEYIAQDVNSPYVLFVTPDMPWKTFAEMKDDLIAKPNRYRYGSSGAGTQEHIALGDLFQKIGAQVQHVPFQNDADKAQSMASGNVQISAGPMSVVNHYGMKPLLVLGENRLEAIPEVPTCFEEGLETPNYHWHAIFAPKGTPPDRVALLSETIKEISGDPAYIEKLHKLGMDPEYLPPDEIHKKAQNDLERYRLIINEVILKK